VSLEPTQAPDHAQHPIQPCKDRFISKAVTTLAYEVYCHIFTPQEALITGNCRGGFGSTELIGLLYARNFPRDQWLSRFREVCGLPNVQHRRDT